MTRLTLCRLFALLLMVIGLNATGSTGSGEIPQADELARIASESAQQSLPVVVFVTRDACPYCRTLRNEVLSPMLAGGKFEGRAGLVEVSLDTQAAFTGFDGNPMTAKVFGAHYKAVITPTLLFLDAAGNELSKARIGISNLELYSHYLNRSIDQAREKLLAGNPMNEAEDHQSH